MGNVISVIQRGAAEVNDERESVVEKQCGIDESEIVTIDRPVEIEPATTRQEEMERFHEDLARKREARRRIIAERKNEMRTLQRTNEKLASENRSLRSLLAENNIDAPEANMALAETETQNILLKKELGELNCALQSSNSENATLNKELFESKRQVAALKEVASVSKQMLAIREDQLKRLKEKLQEIETSLADRETQLLSDDLRTEYEKQLRNIRNLRVLYEERARVADVTRRNLTRQLEDQKLITTSEIEKNQELRTQIDTLQKEIQEKEDAISSKDDQLGTYKSETKGLQMEMAGINQLFTQMLLGHNQSQDLDKLVNRLEEHHDLLKDMAVKENCSDAASALPKLLLDLVSQVENDDRDGNTSTSDSFNGLTSCQEIVGNLPKVWRVLLELLSHQNSKVGDEGDGENPSSCYKSVQTPSGANVLVPSVSKTYIRLKDLILEKKSLQKEMTKMKQLNSHLENRLQDQERRLCLVSSELTKTWHVVGRLRRHHQQLHTHEKILRYELQQKRKLLTEIKEELEYCREKWDMARQKNFDTEIEWKKLRSEFTERKLKDNDDSVNTSAESGFSDEKQTDDEDSFKEKIIPIMKRVENHDSTTDHNPMAEGEDPISDMVDVTDLPLDDQDNESEDISNANGDILSDTEEDEISDTGPTKQKSKVKRKGILKNIQSTTIEKILNEEETPTDTEEIPAASASDEEMNHVAISPAQILENIRLQNERLAARDQRMSDMENECRSIVKQMNSSNQRGEALNQQLGRILERNSATVSDPPEILENVQLQKTEDVPTESTNEDQSDRITISPEQIMENVRLQNERLAARDQRMSDMENECRSMVKQMSTTNERGEALNQQLGRILQRNSEPRLEQKTLDTVACDESINAMENECITNNVAQMSTTNKSDEALNPQVGQNHDDRYTEACTIIPDRQTESPSMSSEEYEARIQAKEERMKRLENQAKSLVNKCNDTKTKSVKIGYKLQELHNIYGLSNDQSTSDSSIQEKEEITKDETKDDKAK